MNTVNANVGKRNESIILIVLISNIGRKRIIICAINPVNYQITSITLEGMADKEVTRITLKNFRENFDSYEYEIKKLIADKMQIIKAV